jgi:hypothetical protein
MDHGQLAHSTKKNSPKVSCFFETRRDLVVQAQHN